MNPLNKVSVRQFIEDLTKYGIEVRELTDGPANSLLDGDRKVQLITSKTTSISMYTLNIHIQTAHEDDEDTTDVISVSWGNYNTQAEKKEKFLIKRVLQLLGYTGLTEVWLNNNDVTTEWYVVIK